MLKIGIIREGKTPPDERVSLVPEQCQYIENQYDCRILIQGSTVRRISDSDYDAFGLEVVDDVSKAEVLFGVKEVPVNDLIGNRTYFFFSHTIKKQPYNRDLLRSVLSKNIRLIDYECLVNEKNLRLLGFGRFAGLVGAYNGFRMIGRKTGKFELKKAIECTDLAEMFSELKKLETGNLRICITGRGRVARGAIEILNAVGIRKVSVIEYLNSSFEESVYVQLAVTDYNRRKDGSKGDIAEFFTDPEPYESDFMRFAERTDFYIACHYWDSKAPFIYTRNDLASDRFKIKYVADISCDIDGPVASTIRPSTIEEPFYGINRITCTEGDFMEANRLGVMAVDNLPCELPVDASEDFGRQLMKWVIPALFNGDKDGILQRATIAENGELTERFGYLRGYVEGDVE